MEMEKQRARTPAGQPPGTPALHENNIVEAGSTHKTLVPRSVNSGRM
jgi:hypothetical protein